MDHAPVKGRVARSMRTCVHDVVTPNRAFLVAADAYGSDSANANRVKIMLRMGSAELSRLKSTPVGKSKQGTREG